RKRNSPTGSRCCATGSARPGCCCTSRRARNDSSSRAMKTPPCNSERKIQNADNAEPSARSQFCILNSEFCIQVVHFSATCQLGGLVSFRAQCSAACNGEVESVCRLLDSQGDEWLH